MGMDFLSVGWTTSRAIETDEEQVKHFLDKLGTEQVLSQIDTLDPGGMYEWDTDDDCQILDNEENRVVAQEVRDTLKFGASVAFDPNSRMANTWQIPGTSLDFTVMGGGSWGDDPFDGYSAVVMLMEALHIWPELKQLTGVICGGLPSAEVIAAWPDTDDVACIAAGEHQAGTNHRWQECAVYHEEED